MSAALVSIMHNYVSSVGVCVKSSSQGECVTTPTPSDVRRMKSLKKNSKSTKLSHGQLLRLKKFRMRKRATRQLNRCRF